MKNKKIFGIGLIVIVLVYLLAGIYFFISGDNGKEGRHLENNEGQEFALQMQEAELKAQEEVNFVFSQIKEGTLEKNTLLIKIEESKNYLQQNLKEVDTENENYMELLYHSAFLMILGGEGNNELTKTAKEIHSYIVETMYEKSDGETEKKLVEELQGMKDEVAEKLADELMN